MSAAAYIELDETLDSAEWHDGGDAVAIRQVKLLKVCDCGDRSQVANSVTTAEAESPERSAEKTKRSDIFKFTTAGE